MAKHIHIYVSSKAKDATYNLRETNGTNWGLYTAASSAEAKELLKRDIKKDPSKFSGVKFLTNGDPDLSQVRAILDTKDAAVWEETDQAVYRRVQVGTTISTRSNGATTGARKVIEMRKEPTKEGTKYYLRLEEAGAKDASNHLGEKEYYTYRRWKEACKAANAAVQFEGNEEICQAKPGVGEWDGAVGVVYKQKASDARYDERVRSQLQAINQLLTEASRKCAGLSGSMPNGDSAIQSLEDMIDAVRRKCFELR